MQIGPGSLRDVRPIDEHVTARGWGTLFVLLSATPAHQPKVGRIESMNSFRTPPEFEELDKVVVRSTSRDLIHGRAAAA